MNNQVRSGNAILPCDKMAKKRNAALTKNDRFWGYIFIIPVFVGILLFVFLPIVMTVNLSFSNWTGSQNIFQVSYATPVFRNFSDLFASQEFWKSVLNTVVYMIGIPIGIVLALLIALGLNRKIFMGEVFKVVYYIPVIASVVAISLLFQRLYAVDGPLNKILGVFGIKPVYWANSGGTMRASIVIMMVWKGLGTSILLFLAGLQGVPTHYYEAARIDGANSFVQFFKITFPFLYPVVFYVIVTSIIGGAQIYAEPNLIYGINVETRSVVQYMIYVRSTEYNGGMASAMALILGIMIFIVTAVQLWLNNRRQNDI